MVASLNSSILWKTPQRTRSSVPEAALKTYQVLAVTLPDGHPARFSLVGFDHAWAEAESVCRAFVTP